MHKVISLAFAFSAWPFAALAQDNGWVEIGKSTTGVMWHLRLKDLNNTNNFSPQVWVSQDHSADKAVPYREVKTLFRFDCRNLKYRTIAVTAYLANGSVYKSIETPDYSDKYAPPDSMIETALQSACPAE